jgi:hypothetical protein
MLANIPFSRRVARKTQWSVIRNTVPFVLVTDDVSTFFIAIVKFHEAGNYSSRHQIACFKATEGLHHAALSNTALLALPPCELRAVFPPLGSAVRVATLYDIAVALKHAIWLRLI